MRTIISSLIITLMSVSAVSYAAETESEQVISPISEEFKTLFKDEISQKLNLKNIRLGTINDNGVNALVLQFDGDITLRQARSILVTSVETVQTLAQKHPIYTTTIPGVSQNINDIALVIDTYDKNLEKDKQFGVSSVTLIRGQVYFMGISHITGGEVLMHKQSYNNAVRMIRDQNR